MENLRISSYIISVKLDFDNEKYFLIHGYTGAFDVVGSDIKDYLFNNKFTNLEEFPFSDELFNKLRERGYLTLKTQVEEQDYVKRIAEVFGKYRRGLFSILFTYCFISYLFIYKRWIYRISYSGDEFWIYYDIEPFFQV